MKEGKPYTPINTTTFFFYAFRPITATGRLGEHRNACKADLKSILGNTDEKILQRGRQEHPNLHIH